MASTTAAAAPRAVTLKGPSTNSKTYFIALPDTLEDLIEKAKRLFPIPPDKTPIITLGNDERAILLQETMPFVRDREPLVFRWVAATPKRQLGNRVRWDDPSSVHFNANAPSSSIGTPSRPSLPHLGKPSSLRLYSPVARAASSTHTPLPPSARANRTQPRDPSIRFGDGVNARQAHARRVLSEQREKEARRQRRLDEGQGGGSDVEMSEEDGLDVFESPTDEPTIDPIAVATTAADTATCENAVPETAPLQPAAAADALLLSPPRKRHPDSVALDTPPSSGSRSSSPYRSLERKKATELQRSHDRENEEQASSPIQSPTRELSAVRQKAAFSITDITNALIAGSELKRITERGNGGATKELAVDAAASGREQATDEGVKDKPVEHENAASGKTEAVVDVRAEADSPVGEPAAVAAARIVAPPATKGEVAARHDDAMERAPALATVADAEVEKTYRYIDNLILQLVSHGSNSVFREPMTKGYLERLPSNARPVDLFTMRQAVQAKEYGSSILADGVKACRAVMLDFETDLAAMYANARRLYGVKSAQAQCADTLEKFSSSFIDEWKRSMDKKPSRADEAVDSEGRKMAMLRQQLTPTKRGEKRGALPGMLPFAFNGTSRLLFPSFSGGAGVGAGASRKSEAAPASAQSTPTTLSAKKQLASENPGAIKRNTSHDGQMDASTAASRRARFSATSNELERSMLDGPFRDFFAQSRTRPTPSAASSSSSRQANPLAAFERALRGPDPAPDSAPVFATATDSAVAVAFAVAAKEVDASAAPHKPVQQQQQNDQVPMAVGPERHEAAAAIQSMEEDLLTPPVSIVEATKEADTMSRTDKQPEQPEQPDVSMAVVAEQESSASETVEKAADVAADAAKGDSRPSEAPSTDDDAAEPTASAPTGGATEVSTAPCSSFDVAAPSPPLQHEPASLGGDEIDQAVKAVLQRAERESSLDSLHSSTESLNAPSAPFPTASGKKGKKRGRPTRAEAAAKMAAAAAAAAFEETTNGFVLFLGGREGGGGQGGGDGGGCSSDSTTGKGTERTQIENYPDIDADAYRYSVTLTRGSMTTFRCVFNPSVARLRTIVPRNKRRMRKK
ncbi:hypothetical protein ACQY0O_004487 [Thecaphora frezii]